MRYIWLCMTVFCACVYAHDGYIAGEVSPSLTPVSPVSPDGDDDVIIMEEDSEYKEEEEEEPSSDEGLEEEYLSPSS